MKCRAVEPDNKVTILPLYEYIHISFLQLQLTYCCWNHIVMAYYKRKPWILSSHSDLQDSYFCSDILKVFITYVVKSDQMAKSIKKIDTIYIPDKRCQAIRDIIWNSENYFDTRRRTMNVTKRCKKITGNVDKVSRVCLSLIHVYVTPFLYCYHGNMNLMTQVSAQCSKLCASKGWRYNLIHRFNWKGGMEIKVQGEKGKEKRGWQTRIWRKWSPLNVNRFLSSVRKQKWRNKIQK
jgi:hypothetical protein